MLNKILRLNDVTGNKMNKIFKHIGIYPFTFKFLEYEVTDIYEDADELKLIGFTLTRDNFDPITIKIDDQLVFYAINNAFKLRIGNNITKIINDKDVLMYKYLQDIYKIIAYTKDEESVYIAIEDMCNSTSGIKKCIIIKHDFYYIMYLTNNNSIIDIQLYRTVASPYIALYHNKDDVEELVKEYKTIFK